jgi:hypothetical protein
MENSTFRFRISFVWYSDVDLWIEIPMELYQRICKSVGNSEMERYEFGFKFSDIIKEKFPELDALIHQEIDKWKSEHYGVNVSDNALYRYGLTSSWFEES